MMNPGSKGTSTRAYNWPKLVEHMLEEGEVFRVRDVREPGQIQTIQLLAAEWNAEFACKGSTIVVYPANCVVPEQQASEA